MAKKPNRVEYQTRTLSFYQAQGGIFNELITYLTKLRQQPKHRGMAAPAILLNDACYHLDYSRTLPEEEAAAYLNQLPAIVRELAERMAEGEKNQIAALSLQAIIDYILAHKQYQFVNQIINMLKDMVGRTCSEEEFRQILAAEQKVMDESQYIIHNHNDIHDSNVFTGMVNNPTYPTK